MRKQPWSCRPYAATPATSPSRPAAAPSREWRRPTSLAALGLAALLAMPGAAGAQSPRQEAADQGFVGKLERALVERLNRREAGPVNVVYWLRGPQLGAGVHGDLGRVTGAIGAAQDGLVATLARAGGQVRYRARYAPAVVAESPAATVRAAAELDEVERVYLERVHAPRLRVSKFVTQATTVHGRGIKGDGQKVGVVEPYRVGSHPNLASGRRVLCRPEASSVVDSHKTEVAGVVGSNDGTDKGQAPAVTVIDGIGADFSDAEMMAATDCVIARGAVAVNMSFGVDTDGSFDAFARYVDATVYNARRLIVVAVSNLCSYRMGSPEIAFNDVSVGSFSDRNTTGFGDDRHSCSAGVTPDHSAYLDPSSPNGDREQPDVVAPGHEITTTTPGGGVSTTSGTSFAAPQVAGLAGLLNDRSPGLLDQPERVRAIIMASARHNIEGASRLSDRDGAGATLDAAADRVLLNGQAWSFSRAGQAAAAFPINQTFTANAGQKVRVALVWAHKSPGGDRATRPTTDLDLQILSPGGARVTTASSRDNNYELAEFTAAATGAYRARVVNVRRSGGQEFIGLAVSRADE